MTSTTFRDDQLRDDQLVFRGTGLLPDDAARARAVVQSILAGIGTPDGVPAATWTGACRLFLAATTPHSRRHAERILRRCHRLTFES